MGTDVETKERYEYSVIFAHRDIESTQQIMVYGATGDIILVIAPGDPLMNYLEGLYKVPTSFALRARKAYLERDITGSETVIRVLLQGYYSNREIQGVTGSSVSTRLVPEEGETLVIANEKLLVDEVTAIQTYQDWQSEQVRLDDEAEVSGTRPPGTIDSFPDGFGVRVILTVTRGYEGSAAVAHESSFKPGSYLVQYRETSGSKTTFTTQQEDLLQISNASYFINHSWDKLVVDFKHNEFWVNRDLFGRDRKDIVAATFDFTDRVVPFTNAASMRDGAYSTSAQLIFFAQPVPGVPFLTVDLGSVEEIDAIDIIAGFYTPDDRGVQKLQVSNWYSIMWSEDGVNFYLASKKAANFNLRGGESFSLEKEDLGDGFKARYLRVILENSQRIDYKDGRWVVSIAEFAVYKNIYLKGEAKLTPNQLLVDSSTLYDHLGLLAQVGDRLYKTTQVDETLDEQWKVDARSKNLLREFQKNHTRLTIESEWNPTYQIGDTVKVVDAANGIDRNYFIEAIRNVGGKLTIDAAYYPGG